MSIQETGHTECALLRAEPASGADKPDSYASGVGKPDIYASGNRITCVDRAIISRYFDGRRLLAAVMAPQPPAKWRRRWIVGGKLPATLRTGPLPRQLEKKLSALDAGYERLMVDCDLLCIEIETLRIVDVMHNAGAPATPDTAQLLLRNGMNATAAGGMP